MESKNRALLLLVTTTILVSWCTAVATTLLVGAVGFASASLTLGVTLGVVFSLFGVSLLAAALMILHRTVLNPIHDLSAVMRTISATKNLSLRVPAEYERGEIEAIVHSINNILDATEHAYIDMLQARYEVESANKGKSLFIAKVSHELRTPIHGITGMLRILLKQESAPGKRQYIQMAQDSATALLDTINEILDFSKMQNGELSLELESFSLPETIRATVEHLVPRFEEKADLAFCWDMRPEVPAIVSGDAARVKNILVNLLGNAFKFADKGHVVLEVSSYPCTSDNGVGVRFTVTDTGIGISPDKLTTIFDPFTTADESTARLYAGTGLGLAIVKQIAERMGGTISVQSTPGAGSRFTVEIPLECGSRPLLPCSQSSVDKKVAILAPAGMRQEIVSEGLRRFGCVVKVFSFDDPAHLDELTSTATSFDVIHIIKGRDVLNDELNPLLCLAAKKDIPVVLSVLSSEISATDQLSRGDRCFVTLQPTSALDILLIASGALVPNTSVHGVDDATEKATQKLNILIADDAKTNRIILKTLLEEAGHTVEVVENGKELLDRIAFKPELFDNQPPPFDLVLTDIQMPVMDGITATQNFRELERQANTERKLPIVAVTSYAFPEECTKMLASGIDHILTKPINPKRLNRLISQITYDSHTSGGTESEEQSDHEIIEELCQLTEKVTQRLADIGSEITAAYPNTGPCVIDIQGIFERSGDSLRRTGLILSGFIESYEEQLVVIEGATLPLADPVTFRRAVHSLKGLLLDAGAQVAAQLAATLEDKAVKEPGVITNDEVTALLEATREAAVVIKEIVGALPSLEVYSALPSIEDALTLH